MPYLLMFALIAILATPALAGVGHDDPAGEGSGMEPASEPGWGYTYDSLRADLDRWRRSPYVWIDTIGASVQGRPIWELTISDPSSTEPRQRIYIHTRTHPNEVQTTWLVNAIIKLLVSDRPEIRELRRRLVVHIVPMYNPDGVELGYGRENARGLDLERNWDKDPMEPEPASLRRRFLALMNTETPIRLALNLHSAVACRRHFIVHDYSGTSRNYFRYQINFVNDVRGRWPSGIAPWDYAVTWVNETPTHFPESWWWINRQETVLAMTYEDMNCAEAGDYDSTAQAIIDGVALALSLPTSSILSQRAEGMLQAGVIYGENDAVAIRFFLPSTRQVTISFHSSSGELVDESRLGLLTDGEHRYDWRASMPGGVYFCTIRAGDRSITLGVVR